MKVIAKSKPPTEETKARLMAHFLVRGWWDLMSPDERCAFFERGEVLDTPFAHSTLLPLIKGTCT